MKQGRTPDELMEFGIRIYTTGLSLLNTVSELEKCGVERSRKAAHDWVQKANLQPADDAGPGYVAPDETVIQINGQQSWLHAAVDLDTDKFLHVRLLTTITTALTQQVPQGLRGKIRYRRRRVSRR